MVEKLDMLTLFAFSFYGTFVLFTIVFLLIMAFCYFWHKQSRKQNALVNQHVVVTGGSSGIGKSVAVEAAKRGANVTIIARDLNKLQSAKDEIVRACHTPTQRIKTVSLDISSNYEDIEKVLSQCEEESGPIFMLVNCAGGAMCAKIEDTTVDDFKYMMQLNFMGTLLPTKYVVPGMKARGGGHIVFTASQAALVGIFGFSAYSSSKYALRGLAEVLHMELNPYKVRVTVSLPPDTDTPGFAKEEESKPLETRLICQTAGLVSPDTVAVQLLDDAINGKFYSSVGFESFLLTTLCGGMTPATSAFDLLIQVCFMGLFRLISVCYLLSFDRIIRKCMRKRDLAKKPE